MVEYFVRGILWDFCHRFQVCIRRNLLQFCNMSLIFVCDTDLNLHTERSAPFELHPRFPLEINRKQFASGIHSDSLDTKIRLKVYLVNKV